LIVTPTRSQIPHPRVSDLAGLIVTPTRSQIRKLASDLADDHPRPVAQIQMRVSKHRPTRPHEVVLATSVGHKSVYP